MAANGKCSAHWQKTKSDEALAVFDLEKQSWRSFRFDSVKEINFSMIGK